MLHKRKCMTFLPITQKALKYEIPKYHLLWNTKFFMSKWIYFLNRLQNAQSKHNNRVLRNYPIHTAEVKSFCYPIVQQSTEADKEAASSHHPHSISMHALLPSFHRRGLFGGTAPTSFSRGTDNNRTRTAAITVVCDYLSPNKSDPSTSLEYPPTHTHTHKKKVS